jgi:hypothetical protein
LGIGGREDDELILASGGQLSSAVGCLIKWFDLILRRLGFGIRILE